MAVAKGSPESCISSAAIMCSRTTKRVSRALTVMTGGGATAGAGDARWEQASAATALKTAGTRRSALRRMRA
jgi:hypothetical protein